MKKHLWKVKDSIIYDKTTHLQTIEYKKIAHPE